MRVFGFLFVFAKIDLSHDIFYFILSLFSSLSPHPLFIPKHPQPLYFRHFPKKRKDKERKKKKRILLPSASSSSLFLSCISSKKSHEPQCLQGFEKNWKEERKEDSSSCPVSASLLSFLCFFSSFLLKG